MRRRILILPALVLLALAAALATGADAGLAQWGAAWQRDVQNAMAGALRALRSKEPGAMAALLALCFSYGVAHAAGPGHGKILIGGYGLGRRVPLLRLSGIAVAASLAQAGTAIALALAGMLLLGWSRPQLTGVAEQVMAPMASAAIGAVGLWLAFRGTRRIWRARRARHAHAHTHAHDEACGEGCGHRHAPTLSEVEAAITPGDAVALIASIGIRPCTGALFLLILTWHMGIVAAGIAGTIAMALGTATVTVATAVLAVLAREGTLISVGGMPGGGRVARALPILEICAGAAIAFLALGMLRAAV